MFGVVYRRREIFNGLSMIILDQIALIRLHNLRMTEVADAQQAITSIIQEMEVKGEIIVSGRRGEEIIV